MTALQQPEGRWWSDPLGRDLDHSLASVSPCMLSSHFEQLRIFFDCPKNRLGMEEPGASCSLCFILALLGHELEWLPQVIPPHGNSTSSVPQTQADSSWGRIRHMEPKVRGHLPRAKRAHYFSLIFQKRPGVCFSGELLWQCVYSNSAIIHMSLYNPPVGFLKTDKRLFPAAGYSMVLNVILLNKTAYHLWCPGLPSLAHYPHTKCMHIFVWNGKEFE